MLFFFWHAHGCLRSSTHAYPHTPCAYVRALDHACMCSPTHSRLQERALTMRNTSIIHVNACVRACAIPTRILRESTAHMRRSSSSGTFLFIYFSCHKTNSRHNCEHNIQHLHACNSSYSGTFLFSCLATTANITSSICMHVLGGIANITSSTCMHACMHACIYTCTHDTCMYACMHHVWHACMHTSCLIRT